MTPSLFAFDVNSHFNRMWSVLTKDGIPNKASAYHAGEPVFVLKPLLNMVEKEIAILRSQNIIPSHIVMVFDSPHDNFRHQLYPDYKANRPEKPEEKKRQEELMFHMFKALGYPCLRIDGVESDDVIGTLFTKLSAVGMHCYGFTGDKDMMSLVCPTTFIYSGKLKKLYSEKEVRLKFNLPASKVIDFLAIQGDSADNLDGIKGVGEKSAIKILEKYTLEEVLDNPDLVLDLGIRGASGVAKKIKENKENALLMKKLVTLKTDVNLGVNLKDLVYKPSDGSLFLNGFLTQ